MHINAFSSSTIINNKINNREKDFIQAGFINQIIADFLNMTIVRKKQKAQHNFSV
ncbi:hypothetical protein Q7O_004503 [Pectobacterium carotovorum subsp. carotovorum PCCS1]|nr:hypothetical protein [Pectobacterium carotovorum subsp. carotovorum PCCS1]